MANLIGKYNRTLKHFQVPSAVFDLGMVQQWSASATKFYFALWRRAQRYSTISPELSASEVAELAGLSLNSVRSARQELMRWGVIEAVPLEDPREGYRYTMLDPETRKPLQDRPPRKDHTDSAIFQSYRKISDLSRDEKAKYFGARLNLPDDEFRDQRSALCPFHPDTKPSLSLNLQGGVWKCHRCDISGCLVEFEMRVSRCSQAEAYKNIAEITGARDILGVRAEPEAEYNYVDEHGEILFTVHLKQTSSCVAAIRTCLGPSVPCGLWQSVHWIKPSLTRW